MSPIQFLLLMLLIFVLGGLFVWIASKQGSIRNSVLPEAGSEDMGYGKERWERELALWNGVLRRLEIQAKYQSPISERLQKEIDEARAKIAHAKKNLE